jgi:hypothetical protein
VVKVRSIAARFFAVSLTALLLPVAGPVLAAQVEGRILGPAGVTPIPGAIVTFHHLSTGVSQVSDPSAMDGSYLVPNMPAGRYDIAVRTGRGLWLANQPLLFGADEVKTLSFALRERAYWEGADELPGRAAAMDENVVGIAVLLEGENNSTTTHPGRKRTILVSTGIGIGVLALALAAGGSASSNAEASPFMPGP